MRNIDKHRLQIWGISFYIRQIYHELRNNGLMGAISNFMSFDKSDEEQVRTSSFAAIV